MAILIQNHMRYIMNYDNNNIAYSLYNSKNCATATI